ncbi:MAG TPA: ABC-2 family transporter protein [Propionibacteriaceae bacterium]|nr:ABC-2 family transporter protein [Propionibacteriaceae bacterium]
MAELSSTEAYRILIGSRIRGQLAYRTSFWLNVATSVAVGLVEFIEIYAVFANVPIFGGLDLRQSALVFALANMGFALADVIFGQLDTIPTYLRLGRLEVLLVRPMPLLLQLITADFQLRRLGRLVLGVLIILAVLPGLDLSYTTATVYLLVVTPVVGAAIYGAFFVTAGGVQFFLIEGAEFTSAFVYGGNYAGQLPGSVPTRGSGWVYRRERCWEIHHHQDADRHPGSTSGRMRTCGYDPVPQRRQVAREVGVVFGQRSQLWWDLPLRDSFRILGAIHRLPTGTPRPGPSSWWTASALPTCWIRLYGSSLWASGCEARWRLPWSIAPAAGAGRADHRPGHDQQRAAAAFLIAEPAEFGTTLLLTTHDMGDIERLCDRVLVIDRGRLVFDGTLPSLAERVALQRVLVVDLPEPCADLRVSEAAHIGSDLDGQRQRLAFSPKETTAAKVLAEVSAVTEVVDLTLEEPAIEDIVRTLYGVT